MRISPALGIYLARKKSKQKAGASAATAAIEAAADNDLHIMFCVFVPEDASLGRAKNFDIWKETVPPIAEFAASKGVTIAVEGLALVPGPAYPALGCTPEMWRAMFAECDFSTGLGLNYDPSHLVRIGIDYLRALKRIRLVCQTRSTGKDTAFDEEALYLHGNLGPEFPKPSWLRRRLVALYHSG